MVGVLENIQQNSLTETQRLQFYVPIEQLRPEEAILFVRMRGNAADYAESVRRRRQSLMPGAAYVSVTPMRDIIDPRQRSWQVGATMFVAERTQEIGVRIALGAGVRDVIRLVIGGALALWASKWIGPMLSRYRHGIRGCTRWWRSCCWARRCLRARCRR